MHTKKKKLRKEKFVEKETLKFYMKMKTFRIIRKYVEYGEKQEGKDNKCQKYGEKREKLEKDRRHSHIKNR